MRKLFLGVAAFSLLLATGCQNEEIVQQANSEEYTLTLDMGAQSRTLHNEEGECIWGENEQLLVVGDGGKVKGTLTLKSKTEGGKKAVFSGKDTGDPAKLEFMVYPVPQEDGTIPMGDFDGVNHNAPMTGSIDGGVVDNVEYAGGLVRMVMEGANTLEIQSENANEESATSGAYTFNPVTGKLDFVPAPATAVTTAKVPANGVVYVPVAPMKTVDGQAPSPDEKKIDMNVKVDDSEETVEIPDVTIEAGAVSVDDVPEYVMTEQGAAKYDGEIKTLTELQEALAKGGVWKLMTDIENVESPLEIAKDLTIIGNDKRIVSSANRVMNINSSDIKVELKDLTLLCTYERQGTNDMRGINITPDHSGIILTLNECNVDFDVPAGCDWAYAVNQTRGAGNTISINGGVYEGANVINVWGSNHMITVNGATLTSLYQPNETYCGVCIALHKNNTDSPKSEGNVLEMSGTTFNGGHAVSVENLGGRDNEIIWGEGNVDNTRVYSLMVNEDFFYTLQEAAQAGSDIKLINHVNTNETFYIKAKQDYNIDLNGHEILAQTETAIVNSGNLTITDSEGNGNGAIKANKTAICHQMGNLRIYGGYFLAYNSALKVLSGDVYIYKGDFYAAAKTFSADRGVVGAAVSVESTDDFRGGHIRTKEGRFEGVYALYLKEDITLSVHGGTFIGDVYGKNQKKFIGTGSFSKDPTIGTDYLNENAKIEKNETTGMWDASGVGGWWNH